MAQALAIIEKLGTPLKCIYEFKTDSILFDPGRNSNKIKDALEAQHLEICQASTTI